MSAASLQRGEDFMLWREFLSSNLKTELLFIAVPSTPFFTIKQSALQLNWDFRNISKLFNLEFTTDCYNPSITVDGNVSYRIYV